MKIPFKDMFSSSKSKLLIYFIALFWLVSSIINKPWEKNLITNDIVSYYSYLPAAIIHHDLSLKFTEGDPFFSDKFWPHTAPNGGKVIKMSMGLSMLYAPFFIVAHYTAPLLGAEQTGYSQHYQIFLWLSTLVYLLIGLFYLRKLLLFYFSEKIIVFTIFSVFFGTNLYWYTVLDGLMSHGYLFSLLSVFLYHMVKWHQQPEIKRIIYIGLLGGLITLIRPTMIVCFLIFLLFDVYNKESALKKFKLIKKHLLQIFLMVVSAIIVFSLQLFYWKYITGDYLFFSYVGEQFYFDNPHIIEGLFGFRKGWLLYTPIMICAIFGMFYLKKNLKSFSLAIVIPFVISIYIMLSWWCWWYGGSFGQRPFVEFYSLLALPFAVFYDAALKIKKQVLKILLFIPMIFFIGLNLFQTYQFKNDLIHFDSMTKESYLLGFFGTKATVDWYYALEEPDYDRARAGKSEKIDYYEINQLSMYNRIALKGFNLKHASCDIGNNGFISSKGIERGAWERFELIYQGHNKIALKAVNNMYVSADNKHGASLIANRELIGDWETFDLIYLDNNRIALKAWNGKFVSLNSQSNDLIIANSEYITKSEIFRIFIY